MSSPKILIVEKEKADGSRLEESLRDVGYAACTTVTCGRRALEEAVGGGPDLALVDVGLDGRPSGIEVGEQLGLRFDVPVIYLTDDTDEDLLLRAEATRHYGCVLKSSGARQLHLNIRTALAWYEEARWRRTRESRLYGTINGLLSKTRILDTILNCTRDGVVAADGAGRILFTNGQAKRLFGRVEDMQPGELHDASARQKKYGLFELDKATYISTDDSPLCRALRGRPTDDREVFVRNEHCPEGAYVSVTGRTLWSDGHDRIEGGVVFFRDVTEAKEANDSLKQAVKELRDQTQLMETVFESMDEAIFVATPDNRRVWANSRMEEMLGVGVVKENPEDWGRLYGVYYPDGEAMVPTDQLVVVRAMRGEVVDDVAFLIRNEKRPEGIYISASGRPLLDGEGQIQAGVAVFRDVTERRRTLTQLEKTIFELREQTQLMETVFESMDAGVVVLGAESELLLSNARSAEMMGSGLDMKRTDEWSQIHGAHYPDGRTPIPGDQLPIMRALRGESTDNMEVFVRNEPNAEGIYLSVSARPLRGAGGQVRAGVAVLHDISRLKHAEDRLERTIRDLRYQTQLMQTVFDNMEEGVLIADTQGNFPLANRRREEIIGKKLIAAEPAEWPATFGAFHLDRETPFPTGELPIVCAMRGEATEDVELFIRNEKRPAGAYVRARGRPLLEDGKVVAGVVIFSDITKYKQAEADLERTISDLRSQAQLVDTVFESISDGVVAADEKGNFTIFNSSAEDIVGKGMTRTSPSQWQRQYGIFRADGETPVPTDQLPLVLAMQGRSIDDLEMFICNEKRPQGVYISVNGRPLQGAAEGHVGGVITFRDVTTRKQAETRLAEAMQDLRNQSELMEAAFNGISEGVVVVNTRGEVLNVNPTGRKIAGLDMMDPSRARLVGKWARFYYPDRETLIPSAELPFNRAIFHGESIDEMTLFFRSQVRPDGFFIRASVRPLLNPNGDIRGAVAIFRDVTAQTQAEEALVQAFAEGRMEMLDTIVHNIGNAINSVTTGIDTLQRHLDDDQVLPRLGALANTVKSHRDDWSSYVANDPQGEKVLPLIIALAEDLAYQRDGMAKTTARVRDRANHIADIVRTQRTLDNRHMERKDVNLRSALGAAVRVLHDSLLKRGVRVEIECGGALFEIRIQESRFHQMMVNLIKNSMEAIDERAASHGFEETPRIRIRSYCEGDYLNIDVIDNGIGIDIKNTRILFSAGYTTKESGSGLGLHSAANFVTGSGGRVLAFSDGIGRGATVRVMLRLSTLTPPTPLHRVLEAEQDADYIGPLAPPASDHVNEAK